MSEAAPDERSGDELTQPATMADLQALAAQIVKQMGDQVNAIQDQIKLITMGQAGVDRPAPLQLDQMNRELMALPYYQNVVSLIAALDQEMSLRPGPITPERIIPLVHRHLIGSG